VLHIGDEHRAHVIIRPNRRQFPSETDYWDGNWLQATIEITTGGFRGRFDAMLRAEDFVRFREQLRPLNERLSGVARFDTMEEWLRIEVDGDGKGHFRADCSATDQPGVGNRLTFAVDIDQTELPRILRALDAICDEFPLVGKR